MTFTAAPLPDLLFTDGNADLQPLLPARVSGNVTIRVVDTNHAARGRSLDTISIGEMWIWTIP